MIIQYEEHDESQNIDEAELQHVGHQLKSLTDFYMQFIAIDDPQVVQNLKTLHDIGEIIIHKEYHKLINDTSLITNQESRLTTEEYNTILHEFLYDNSMYNGKPF